jgi:hypothetical protein
MNVGPDWLCSPKVCSPALFHITHLLALTILNGDRADGPLNLHKLGVGSEAEHLGGPSSALLAHLLLTIPGWDKKGVRERSASSEINGASRQEGEGKKERERKKMTEQIKTRKEKNRESTP